MSQSSKKVALVTGVSRAEGLGYEVCRQLADHGIAVILTARDLDKANGLAQRLLSENASRTVRAQALDVTDEGQTEELVALIERDYGLLDILINNAAAFGSKGETAAGADLGIAKAVMDVTLFGTWRLCAVFLPLLRRSVSGRIVNVSSGAGSFNDPVFGLMTTNSMGASYAVAKAALTAFTIKLASEERNSGVLINAVCPGFTATFPGAESFGARPVVDGASSIVWAALLPAGGPTGGFFRDGQPLPW